jgi:hypothetical protein
LNEFEKGEALWEYGIHLSQRTEGEIGYSLYQLHDFYVEVKYNGGINAITKFTSFSTYTKFEPYLQNIKPPVGLGANLTLTFFIL